MHELVAMCSTLVMETSDGAFGVHRTAPEGSLLTMYSVGWCAVVPRGRSGALRPVGAAY